MRINKIINPTVRNNRQNRTAIGFSLNEERRVKHGKVRISNPKHPDYNEEKDRILLGLMVRGTTDVLKGGYYMLCKKIKIEHPTDKGFFKEVYVLNEFGKNRLKKLKQNRKENV